MAMAEDCPEQVAPEFVCDEQLGGIMPVLVSSRCVQHADVWLQVARALEGTDLVATAAAVAHMKASLKAVESLTKAVEGELDRRKSFADDQARARRRIEEVMNSVKRDVSLLGDALFSASAIQVQTEDISLLVGSLMEEERHQAAKRALASAVAPPDGSLPTNAALRCALDLAASVNLPPEETQAAYDALEQERRRADARYALARALTPTPENRNVEDIAVSLEAARVAGLHEAELNAAEEALREGQKSSIWYDIISIIAEDGETEGAPSGNLLAGLLGFQPVPATLATN